MSTESTDDVKISECHSIECSECGSGHMPMISMNIEFPSNGEYGKCSDVEITGSWEDSTLTIEKLPEDTIIVMNYKCAICHNVRQGEFN